MEKTLHKKTPVCKSSDFHFGLRRIQKTEIFSILTSKCNMSKSQLQNGTKSTLRHNTVSVVSVKVPKWAIMPIFFANERSSGRVFSESGRY
jgi:hypothetical protein